LMREGLIMAGLTVTFLNMGGLDDGRPAAGGLDAWASKKRRPSPPAQEIRALESASDAGDTTGAGDAADVIQGRESPWGGST
jgi:hypothetical protein